MRVGDLVRPKSIQYKNQLGIIISIGFMRSVGVRLLCGRVATYNHGSLEVVSES